MTTFKLAKKDAVSDTRTNIYDLYEKKLDYFESKKNKLASYKLSLNNLKAKNKIASLTERYALDKQISQLQESISNIEENNELNDYLLDFFQTIHSIPNNVDLFEEHKNKGQMDSFCTSRIDNSKIDLYRIFNEFIVAKNFPFILYQTIDGNVVYSGSYGDYS